MLFCWYLSSLILLVSSFLISSVSILKLPWTSFTYNNTKYTQELFSGKSSQEKYREGDYYCIESISCNSNNQDLCDISKNLHLARQLFLPFEICCLIMQLFIIERLILKLLRKPIGNSFFFLMIIWICPIIKTIGILVFLLIPKASLDTSNNEENTVKAEIAVFLLIASLCLLIVANVLLLVFKVYKSEQGNLQIEEVEINKFITSGFLLVLSFVLFLLANIYPAGTIDEYDIIELGLTDIKKIDEYENGLSFECIAEQECLMIKDICNVLKTFKSIRESSVYIEAFGYLFGLIWVENFVLLLLKTRYINKLSLIITPILYFVLNFSMLLLYCIKGRVNFTSGCKINSSKEDWNVCASKGILFYIVSLIFSFLSLITFEFNIILYTNKQEAGSITERPSIMAINTIEIKKIHASNVAHIDNSALFTYSHNILADQTVSTIEASSSKTKSLKNKVQ